jgi:hypothetical protein
LKKIDAKKCKTPFLGSQSSGTSSQRFLVSIGNLDKIMVHLDGLKAMKGGNSLGQQVEKNEIFWFGLLLEGKTL